MSRYLLGAILALIGFMTLYGIGSSQTTRRTTGASRDAISANANATTAVASIEDAGRSVSRQFSGDGPVVSAPDTPSQPNASVVGDPEIVRPDERPDTETPDQPETPQTSPRTEQEAIPALW